MCVWSPIPDSQSRCVCVCVGNHHLVAQRDGSGGSMCTCMFKRSNTHISHTRVSSYKALFSWESFFDDDLFDTYLLFLFTLPLILPLCLSLPGKSYTMIGRDDSLQTLGIIPCAISWLFKLINERKEKTGARFSVRVSAVEVSVTDETSIWNIPCRVKQVPLLIQTFQKGGH